MHETNREFLTSSSPSSSSRSFPPRPNQAITSSRLFFFAYSSAVMPSPSDFAVQLAPHSCENKVRDQTMTFQVPLVNMQKKKKECRPYVEELDAFHAAFGTCVHEASHAVLVVLLLDLFADLLFRAGRSSDIAAAARENLPSQVIEDSLHRSRLVLHSRQVQSGIPIIIAGCKGYSTIVQTPTDSILFLGLDAIPELLALVSATSFLRHLVFCW